MKVLGIDVGLTGALAVVKDGKLLWVDDMPMMASTRSKKRVLDVARLAKVIACAVPDHIDAVVIEGQSAAPGQGVGGTFTLGWQAGLIEGLARGNRLDVHVVKPSVWKAAMRLSSDKGLSLQAARRLWPASKDFTRVKDHGRAEAALLAWWYERLKMWAKTADGGQATQANGIFRELTQAQDEIQELARAREAVA